MSNSIVKNLDWVSVILYLLLVSCGWIAIFSTTYSDLKASSIFDLNQFYGKQLLFIALSFLLILFILAIDSKLYINLAVTFYLIAIVLLAGLFVFGKETNGARAWYAIGSITVQPSEFAKVATALAFSRYVSDIHTDVRRIPDLLRAIAIICIPSFLILLQPDVGSLLVFFSLLFVLFREGMPSALLFYLFLAGVVFVSSLKFGTGLTLLASALCIGFYVFWHKRRTNRIPFANLFILSGICLVTALATHPAFPQMIYRVGDSITNPITPMMPYMPLLLSYAQRYSKNIGMGTLIAALMPYTIAFTIFWTLLLIGWYLMNWQLGPGGFIYL